METKLLKRLFSMCIVLALVLSMCPTFVFAESTTQDTFVAPDPTTVPCPCALCNGAVPTWVVYSGQTATGHYYLTADYTLSQGQGGYNGKKVVINLNGFDINCIASASGSGSVSNTGHFYATGSTTTLDIMDSAAHEFNGQYISGAITGGDASPSTTNAYRRGGNVGINSSAKVTLHSGAITDGYAQRGGNVYVSSGTFTMYGGLITGGDTSAGYGSEVMTAGSSARFNFYGGTITGTSNEPAVQSMYSQINMYGGTINQTGTGDAVRLNNTSADYSPLTNIYGGTVNGKFLTSDSSATANTDLNIYGGTFKQLSINTYTNINIYNGVFESAPQNYLAPCACVWQDEDGKFNVWAYGHKNGTCTDCNYATALTTYGDYITQQSGEHTLGTSDASSTGYACSFCAVEMDAPTNVNILHAYCEACEEEKEFLPWDGVVATGHVYVEEDIVLEDRAYIASGDTMCLDLNGNTITAASGKRAFTQYGSLNIQDSSAEKTGTVTATEETTSPGDGGLIYSYGTTLQIFGGTFTGGKGDSGGTIYFGTGTALITGNAKIKGGNASAHGGNMYVTGSAKVTIDGNAEISSGQSGSQGGNIYVTGASARLYIRGGTISGGSNGYAGGNLGINTGGHAYMYGGTIKDGIDNYNTTGNFGGGNVWVFNYSGSSMSTFVMYGGTISGGTSKGGGNLICARGAGRAYIYGGTILEQAEDAASAYPYREFGPSDGGGIFFYNVQSKHAVSSWVADCSDYCYKDGTYVVWHTTVADDACGYLTALADTANGIVANEAIEHTYSETTIVHPDCVNGGYTKHTCACGQSYTDADTPANGHEDPLTVVPQQDATCQAAGVKTYSYCSVCNAYYEDEIGAEITDLEAWKTGDGAIAVVGHSYGDDNSCIYDCGATAGAVVTYANGSIGQFENLLDALVAANTAEGRETVHVLKDSNVEWHSTFTEENPLINVTITAAEGVTVTNASAYTSETTYIGDVTFDSSVKLVTKGQIAMVSGTTNIYSTDAYIYMPWVYKEATMNVYGDQGAFLETERDMSVEGVMNIYGKGDGTVVMNATTHTNKYTLYITGRVYVEKANIVIDAIKYTSGEFVLNDSAIEITEAGTETEAALRITSGYKISMSANSTITTATADLQNVGIAAAEGVDGCVWYEDGAYAVKAHNGADATCTENGLCSNCNAVVNEATGEHSYVGVRTEATATSNAYTTYTCSVCSDSYIEEEEGTMLRVAINEATGESYATVQEALSAAPKGSTVKLLKDAEEEDLYVGDYKTLDLNGHTLTAETVAASFSNSYIIDNTNGEGLLVVDKESIALNESNKQLPLWYDEGARFVSVSYLKAVSYKDKTGAANEDVAYYRFAFADLAAKTILDDFLANGTEGTGISVRIKATWTNANGTITQYFTFTSELVQQYVTGGRGWDANMFKMYLSGIKDVENLSFTAEIVSFANTEATVVIGSEAIS